MSSKHIPLLCWIPLVLAYTANADEQNLGDTVPTKNQVIEMLAPSAPPPAPRTRGFGMGGSASMATPALHWEKSVSLALQFDYNSDQLSKSSLAQLRPVCAALASDRLSSASFIIEGHTDSVGNADYNRKLSERRAATVRKFLVDEFAISPDRIDVKGIDRKSVV